MKRINSMVEDSVKEHSQLYLSNNEKKALAKDIVNSAAALVCLISGLIYSKLFPEQDVIAGLIYFAGVLIVGFPVIFTAVKGFLKKDVGASMEILVSIAMIVSAVDGQYVVAILIPVILTVVHFLEEKSIMGGRDAIEGLKKLQSDFAIILVDGEEKEVNAKSLQVGDVIIVKPGMSLPIDGTVVDGSSSMDQKSLTGESLPNEVKKGDQVFAGTTNIDGLLNVRVDKAYADTSFQRIVELLEGAEKMTIPETRIVDKFMVYYIPIAIVIATLVWLFSKDISKAIAILVVSCPCGYMLVSSAPIISALAASTKRGILIKNPSFIDKLTDVNYFIFDKTGTITNGTLEAVDFHLEAAQNNEELLQAAACVAHGSLHPTSKSIMKLCQDIEYDTTFQIVELVGNGVRGKNDKDEILIGNSRYVSSLGYSICNDYEQDGTLSWIIKNDTVLGCIVFQDILRDDVEQSFEELKSLGVDEICVLTGDNAREAQRITNNITVDHLFYELLPEQKLEKVKEAMLNHTVAVVGDGINDSLALSQADVGIAMGAMGSDTAIQSADVSLMNNSLHNLSFAVKLARKTKDIIYQNIIIAFAISVVMIFLAACGVVTPIVGAFLHNIGAFVILVNSGRIIHNPESKTEDA